MLRIAASLLACVVVLVPAGQAQVAEVRNTGCPNSGYPQHNNTVRINSQFQFTWLCRPPEFAFAVLGLPSGGGIDFYPPATCSAGPCRLYPAPFGNEYFLFPISGAIGNFTLDIPNDRRLIQSTFSVQAGCGDTRVRMCFQLGGALSFAITP